MMDVREKKRAYDRAYRVANREKRRSYNRAWNAANPEKNRASNRAWYASNPEKARENSRAWRAENREKQIAYKRARRLTNQENDRAARRSRYAANREKYRVAQRAYDLVHCYQMTTEEYATLLVAQGGVCAICGGVQKTGRCLEVDHAHDTGRVRGLLCGRCNRALGFLNDSPTLLEKARFYLLRAGWTEIARKDQREARS